MENIDQLLEKAGTALKKNSDSSPTAAGPKVPAAGNPAPVDYQHGSATRTSDSATVFEPGLVDAINQVFSEFAFAYHNQFHKAYPDQASINIGKEYWLSCLAEFSPQQITQAARKLVKTSDYLPTVAAMVRSCQSGLELFGLPAARDAYLEACRAPSPKQEFNWSHPAVYHAAKASDWFVLATQPESVAFPIFEYNYQQICQRVMQGEDFTIQPPPALTDTHGKDLTPEERKKQMRKLRESLNL
jgi:hypothetical protein